MLPERLKILWELPDTCSEFEKEFIKVQCQVEASPILEGTFSIKESERYQFSNFTSIILRPEEQSTFREVIASLTETFHKEKIKSWVLEKLKNHSLSSARPEFDKIELFVSSFCGKEDYLRPLSSMNEFFDVEKTLLSFQFHPEALLEFCEESSLVTKIKEFTSAKGLINDLIYQKLYQDAYGFYNFLCLITSFEFSALKGLELISLTRDLRNRAKNYLKTSLRAVQIKRAKKNNLEKILCFLQLLNYANSSKDLAQKSTLSEDLSSTAQKLKELRLCLGKLANINVIASLKDHFEEHQNKFYTSLVEKTVNFLDNLYINYFDYFKNLLENLEVSPKPTSYTLPLNLLEPIKLFCSPFFLVNYRKKIGETIRQSHRIYSNLVMRCNSKPRFDFKLFESYFWVLEQISLIHQEIVFFIDEKEEVDLFNRLLSSQSHRFAKKLISNLSLENIELSEITRFIAAIETYCDRSNLPSKSLLFGLQSHLCRLILNASQQRFLETLPSTLEVELWEPVTLTAQDKKLLTNLGAIDDQAKLFFRFFLLFLLHVENLSNFSKSFPFIKSEIEQRATEAILVVCDRIKYFLIDGYATDYNKIKKINSRILATTVVQIEFLRDLLPNAISKTLVDATSSLEQTIEIFIQKISSILKYVIERNASKLFAMDFKGLVSPSVPSYEVVSSLKQLAGSTCSILNRKNLSKIFSSGQKIVEDSFLLRLRSILAQDQTNKIFITAEIDYLKRNVSLLFGLYLHTGITEV